MSAKFFGWAVVSSVSGVLLSAGVSFMTTPHFYIADTFFFLGFGSFLVKFWTWEEAKNDTTRGTAKLLAGVSVVVLLLFSGSCWLSYHLNSPMRGPAQTIIPPPLIAVAPTKPSAPPNTVPTHPKSRVLPKMPSPTATQNVPAPGSITQHSEGNCSPNIVGIGNTTNCDTKNKYGQISAFQQRELAAVLMPFDPNPIQVVGITNGASPETLTFEDRLGATIEHVYASTSVDTAILAGEFPRGLSANGPSKDQAFIQAMSEYLVAHRLIDKPIRYQVSSNEKAKLQIIVAEPE